MSDILTRVSERVEIKGDCHIWPAYRLIIQTRGKALSVRQEVFKAYYGFNPNGNVKAACGNSHCVNPLHLTSRATRPLRLIELTELLRPKFFHLKFEDLAMHVIYYYNSKKSYEEYSHKEVCRVLALQAFKSSPTPLTDPDEAVTCILNRAKYICWRVAFNDYHTA